MIKSKLQMLPLTTSVQQGAGNSSQSNRKKRKKEIEFQIQKGVNIYLFADKMILYVENHKAP